MEEGYIYYNLKEKNWDIRKIAFSNNFSVVYRAVNLLDQSINYRLFEDQPYKFITVLRNEKLYAIPQILLFEKFYDEQLIN